MKEDYLDMRNIEWRQGACPVRGCSSPLDSVPYRKGKMPYCPEHKIRLHNNTKTFVYDESGKKNSAEAALRNILFDRDYFGENILGHAGKAESHRICHETSEDALTWNVFSCLARHNKLQDLVLDMTGQRVSKEPVMYLWGLQIDFDNPSARRPFAPLVEARRVFEADIRRFKTEPDIMLYVPNELLLLIEAKFTSGNTVATQNPCDDKSAEKPKSRAGIIQRYTATKLPEGILNPETAISPFYAQLYRNLVFAIFMSEKLGVEWSLANLVSERQSQKKGVEYQDPTGFIQSVLSSTQHKRFRRYTWEKLHANHIQNDHGLENLSRYMSHKSANCSNAFQVNVEAEIFCGYAGQNLKKIGTLKLEGNRLTLLTESDDTKDMIMRGPFDFKTQGKEAYEFTLGRFVMSSTIFIKEIN